MITLLRVYFSVCHDVLFKIGHKIIAAFGKMIVWSVELIL